MQNSGENAFAGIPVGAEEPGLVSRFLDTHDFAPGTRRGIVLDLRKLARWFTEGNKEPFIVGRVTMRDVTDLRDVTDFREYLRRDRGRAVATVNRTLVMVRRFFGWLVEKGLGRQTWLDAESPERVDFGSSKEGDPWPRPRRHSRRPSRAT